MKTKIQELSPKEVLSLAIFVERSNYHSLNAFAQFFEGNDEYEIAARFKELAQEELGHEKLLTRRYEELFGGGTPEPVDFQFGDGERDALLNVFRDKQNGFFDKARKVYELALIGEKRARDFYQEAADTATLKELKLLFSQLVLMEENHSYWLEEKVAKDKAGN